MTHCHICGEDTETETLQLGRGRYTEPWQLARVCEECRMGKLLPVLRQLFDGGINLGGGADEPASDLFDPGSAFRTYEHPRTGTVHVLDEMVADPASVVGHRLVGECGISFPVAEPDEHVESHTRALTTDGGKGPAGGVCERCLSSRPEVVL